MKTKPRSIDEIERDQLTSPFGRDIGLVHEVLIQGRKRNVGRAFWRLLHENEDVFERAIEAALTFPTFKCSLKNVVLPIPELIELCKKREEAYLSERYEVHLTGTLTVDEDDEIAYNEDFINLSLFPVPRETSIRDIEHQLAGLYYRPARLKEMLLLAEQYRESSWPTYIVCLQKAFLNKKEVRVALHNRLGRHTSHVHSITDIDVVSKINVFDGKQEWTTVACVKLPRTVEE